MSVAVDDYAAEVRSRLEDLRRQGADFDRAWRVVEFEIRPLDKAGWGAVDSEVDGVESPHGFLYRHMRAAYVGRDASPHCQVGWSDTVTTHEEGCARLAPGGRCVDH